MQVGVDDGVGVLRREIDDSMMRVKAAKKGAPVIFSSPRHEASFYYPDQ